MKRLLQNTNTILVNESPSIPLNFGEIQAQKSLKKFKESIINDFNKEDKKMRFDFEDNTIIDNSNDKRYTCNEEDLMKLVEDLNEYDQEYMHQKVLIQMFRRVIDMDFEEVIKNVFGDEYSQGYDEAEKQISLNTKKERV